MDIEKLMGKFEEGFKKIVKVENVKVEVKQEAQKEVKPIENVVNRNNFDLSTPAKTIINKAVDKINSITEREYKEIKDNPIVISPIVESVNHVSVSNRMNNNVVVAPVANRIENVINAPKQDNKPIVSSDNQVKNIIININNEKEGIEITFTTKPTQEVLTELKSHGFRWHNGKKIWYSKQSEQRFQFAYSLITNEASEVQEESIIENVSITDPTITSQETQNDPYNDIDKLEEGYLYSCHFKEWDLTMDQIKSYIKILTGIENYIDMGCKIGFEGLTYDQAVEISNISDMNKSIFFIDKKIPVVAAQQEPRKKEIEPLQIIETIDNNIFVNALVPAINKNDTKEENDQEIDIKSSLKMYQIVKMIILSDSDYQIFCNSFLTDYEFLKGTRTNSQCICIMCKDKEPLIVDPSGHNYARYVCRLIEEVDQSIEKAM